MGSGERGRRGGRRRARAGGRARARHRAAGHRRANHHRANHRRFAFGGMRRHRRHGRISGGSGGGIAVTGKKGISVLLLIFGIILIFPGGILTVLLCCEMPVGPILLTIGFCLILTAIIILIKYRNEVSEPQPVAGIAATTIAYQTNAQGVTIVMPPDATSTVPPGVNPVVPPGEQNPPSYIVSGFSQDGASVMATIQGGLPPYSFTTSGGSNSTPNIMIQTDNNTRYSGPYGGYSGASGGYSGTPVGYSGASGGYSGASAPNLQPQQPGYAPPPSYEEAVNMDKPKDENNQKNSESGII